LNLHSFFVCHFEWRIDCRHWLRHRQQLETLCCGPDFPRCPLGKSFWSPKNLFCGADFLFCGPENTRCAADFTRTWHEIARCGPEIPRRAPENPGCDPDFPFCALKILRNKLNFSKLANLRQNCTPPPIEPITPESPSAIPAPAPALKADYLLAHVTLEDGEEPGEDNYFLSATLNVGNR
jgi:hypothetical protein